MFTVSQSLLYLYATINIAQKPKLKSSAAENSQTCCPMEFMDDAFFKVYLWSI